MSLLPFNGHQLEINETFHDESQDFMKGKIGLTCTFHENLGFHKEHFSLLLNVFTYR